MKTSTSQQRTSIIVAAAIVIVLGALSAIDVRKRIYTGYHTDDNFKVRTVEPGSPAAQAGVQVGDILKSAHGTRVSDYKAFMNLPRPAVGTMWPYVFERAGAPIHFEILQAPLPERDVNVARAATVIGLILIGFTLWAYISAPGTATALLAVLGLTFGAGMLGMPSVESPAALRNGMGALELLLPFLGTVAILHFLLVYPSPKKFLSRPAATKLLYGPLLLVGLLGIAFIVTGDRKKFGLALGILMTLFFVVYFITAIVVLVRRFAGASADERRKYGLGLMLATVVIVFGAFLAYPILSVIWPTVGEAAYSAYHPILQLAEVALVPIAFAIAAVRSARAPRVS